MQIPPPAPYGTISKTEVLTLVGRICFLVAKLLSVAVTWPFSSHEGSLQRKLFLTFGRTIMPPSSIRQLQFILPSTGQMYKQYIQSWKKSGESVGLMSDPLEAGGTLHWIGPKKAQIVLVYFHGGGFILPAMDGHFKLFHHLRSQIRSKTGREVSVALLEHSLLNAAPWPTQLLQCHEALKTVLSLGYSPSDVILAGDSAGGGMTMALLGHFLHPHPAIQNPFPLNAPLRGVLLISPWCVLTAEAKSFKTNSESDMLPGPFMEEWGKTLIANARANGNNDENWFQSGRAQAEWWSGLESVTKNILVLASMGEVMHDDIVTASERISQGAGSKVSVVLWAQPRPSVHNEPILEFGSNDGPGPSTGRILDWLHDLTKRE